MNAHRHILLSLVLVTLAALILRAINLNSDLWLDEIASVRRFSGASVAQILTTYQSTNNHLLNSIFISAITLHIGGDAWMLRAPAVLFGVLAIPTMFWLARRYFTARVSVLAALLLAVAYQHIFFSQNARGYTAYFLFALIASYALSRLFDARAADPRGVWMIGYIFAAWFGVLSHLTMLFVIAGHGLTALLALLVHTRRGERLTPMIVRLAVLFGAVGVLCLVTLMPIIAPALALVNSVYVNDRAVGYSPLSLEFAQEMLRGLTNVFSPALLIAAIPAGVIGLIGAVSLMRRDAVLLLALSSGPAVHFGLSIVRDLQFSPRFLLILLIPAILVALEVLRLVSRTIASSGTRGLPGRTANGFVRPTGIRRGLANSVWVIGGAALVFGLALPLRTYYTMPKQAYTAAIAYVQSIRAHDQLVVSIHTNEQGFLYYGAAFGDALVYARTVEALEAAQAQAGEHGTILVTSLERGLSLDVPDLWAMIQQQYEQVARFPGSVGDGDMRVYIERR